jgi:hypothetical protein
MGRMSLVEQHAKLMEGLAYQPGTIGPVQMDSLAFMVAPVADITTPPRIAQVGLGYGRSAYAFLSGHPFSEVVVFDDGYDTYMNGGRTTPVFDRLQTEFGQRISVVWGKTRNTLPEFECLSNFNYIHIDAGHDYDNALHDMLAFRHCQNAIVIADDVVEHWPGVVQAWSDCVYNGVIKELYRAREMRGNEVCAWAVGEYV